MRLASVILSLFTLYNMSFADKAQQFIPKDSMIVVQLDLGQLEKQLPNVFQRLGLLEVYNELIYTLKKESGLDFSNLQLAGSKMGIDVQQPVWGAFFDMNSRETRSKIEPGFTISAKISDQTTLIQLLEQMVPEMLGLEEIKTVSYKGFDYTVLYSKEEIQSYNYDYYYYEQQNNEDYQEPEPEYRFLNVLAYAIVDDLLIFGNEISIQKAIDAFLYKESVLTVKDYTNTMAQMPSQAFLKGYIGYKYFLGDLIEKMMKDGKNGSGFAVTLKEDGLFMEDFGQTTAMGMDGQLMNLLYKNLNPQNDLMEYLPPGDASFLYGNLDLVALLESLQDSEWAFVGYMYATVLSSLFGIAIQEMSYNYYGNYTLEYNEMDYVKNFLSNMTGQGGYVMYGTGKALTTLELGYLKPLFFFECINKTNGYKMLNKINESLRLNSIEVSSVQMGTDYFFALPLSYDYVSHEIMLRLNLQEGDSFYYGMIGNYIVASYDKALLDKIAYNYANKIVTNWYKSLKENQIFQYRSNGLLTGHFQMEYSAQEINSFVNSRGLPPFVGNLLKQFKAMQLYSDTPPDSEWYRVTFCIKW